MNPVVALHDIADSYGFCTSVLESSLRGNGGYMRTEMRDEATSYLVLELVVLAGSYRPGNGTFESYAQWLLRRRLVDFYRATLGDNRGERRRPTMASIDELDERDLDRVFRVESGEDEVITRLDLAAAAGRRNLEEDQPDNPDHDSRP